MQLRLVAATLSMVGELAPGAGHTCIEPKQEGEGEGKRKIEPEPSAVHLAAALMALLQARHLDLAWRSIQMLEPRNLMHLAVWRRECIERKYLHWEK